ncbi:beta-eliminating lyase-related protein [Aliamphritea spongicola]|nr:beta-eliminating lyase-related protein [Aliamphritea spongicola]
MYLSNATELGTLYSKQELTAISEFCRENGLYLFLDGARLATALTAEKNNLTLKDIAKLTDLFSMGATKNGALIGEAIVINNNSLAEDFTFHVKQRGGMLSKAPAGYSVRRIIQRQPLLRTGRTCQQDGEETF